MNKYRCPTCGFQIFNRRVRKCESCDGELPESLLYSPAEISALDAQHEQSRKEREEQIRKERQKKQGGPDRGTVGPEHFF